MKIDEFKYKGYNVNIVYSQMAKLFFTNSIVGNTYNHENIEEAINEHKVLIDNFLNIRINSYEDLGKKIVDSLVFTDRDECYINENILKHLVESFIKTNNKKSN